MTCPDPETWAAHVGGAAGDAAWRSRVRHLAACAGCRRHVSLLAASGTATLPPARLEAPLPLRAPRRRLWGVLAQGMAAAVVFGAGVYALVVLNRPRAIPPAPEAFEPKRTIPAPPPGKDPVAPPPPPRIEREKPVSPLVVEDESPAPGASAPVAPPVPSPFVALHEERGRAEPVVVSASEGLVVVRETRTEPLGRSVLVSAEQAIRAPQGGSLQLPDGASIHLAAGGEVAVSWSRTHLSYSLEVLRGEALVELGEAPRLFHVASGPLGVRLQEASGRLWASGDGLTLRVSPLSGPAAFRTPAGEGRVLEARQALVLGHREDGLEPAPESAGRFPSAEPPAAAAPAPVAPPRPAPPALVDLVRELGARSYRYRVAGRHLREGAWLPEGILASGVDELLVVRRTLGTAQHVRRGIRPWDDLGTVRPGAREDQLLGFLRNAQAPHLQVEQALAAVTGEAPVREALLADRACSIHRLFLDPARIRDEVEAFMTHAVGEGRMAKPDAIHWETLEGMLDVAAVRGEGPVVRVTDRRRVAYSVRTSTRGLLSRRTWVLETVYEFHDHGRAQLKLPAEIIKDLQR